MDRSQLQKFAQYLIASHPNKVLPSAQQLADELLQPESSINKTSDAASSSNSSNGVANSILHGSISRSASDLGHFDAPGSAVLGSETDTMQADGANPNLVVQTESGLNWLLRYRRLMLNQTLLGGPVSCPIIQSGGPLSSLHLNVSPETTNATHWFASQTGPLLNSLSSDMLTCGSASWHHGSGAQIAAMFAKVRELLAKRDSNGPRLLSLITEELLRCPKLPLLKARRTHRTTDMPGRMSMPGLTRSLSAQQLSPNPSPESNLGTNSFSHPSSISSIQLPTWTTRLWEEVCVLWTCVVLNPDCSAEARRQWRNRLLSWVRAHRCPRDEAYAVPGHYFATVRDQSELEEDMNMITSQVSSSTSQPQPSGRMSSRRASVFQLPLEASFLSWNDDCLRRLVGLESMKKCDATSDLDVTFDSPPGRSSVEMDETGSVTSEPFRRPSSNTSRRGPVGQGRPHTSRDCQCPYCEQTGQLNEPFPLLCLRVAALRANGYQMQALRLAVFISQRLLRGFKSKAASANNSLVSCLMRNSACKSTAFWNGAHNSEASVRRSLFAGSSVSGRVPTMNGYVNPPPLYNNAGRYTPTNGMLSPSSTISNHSKYHSSGRLPSPRPSSISPPISAAIPRPGSRRHVLSPGPNSSPMCSSPANRNNLGSGPPASVYKSIPPPHPSAPSLPSYTTHSPSSVSSFPHIMHAYPNAPSPVPQPPLPPPPFHHYSPYHYPHHFSQSNPSPYAFSTANYLPNSSRQLVSPKLPGRPTPHHTIPHRSLSLNGVNNSGINGNVSLPYPSVSGLGTMPEFNSDALHLQSAATSSPVCPSHTTDSAWIGLPGRPIICLVECLLDAAAMVVESSTQLERHQQHLSQHHRPTTETTSYGQLESASFYLCLAVKVSLVALFQQRRLSGSINRLLASQTQEARLLAWLSTMPKDAVTLMAVCETMAHLLGPPALSRLIPRAEPNHTLSLSVGGHLLPSPAWWWWWWSSLGPITHPDSYPVHGIAHFVLDYVLEARTQTPLSFINNFWTASSSPALSGACPNLGLSSPSSACTGPTMSAPSAIRVDDLLFAVVTRAIRFSVLEPVSDSMGLIPVNARPPNPHSHHNHVPPPSPYHAVHLPYHHYPSPPGASPLFTSRPTERSPFPTRYWTTGLGSADVESALAVNTEISELSAVDPTTLSSTRAETPESHGVSTTPLSSAGLHHLPTPSSHLRPMEPDRWPLSSATSTIPYPPFPSAFASAVQACIKLLDIPYTQSASCMPIPPVMSTPAYLASRTLPSPITCIPEPNSLSSPHQPTPSIPSVSQPQQLPPPPPLLQIGTIFAHSNTPVRRCLEGMELQQTHLAVALVRLSKSSLLRLDQIVQIFDRHIHSAVSLLAISQQIFAEAVGLESMLSGVRKYDSMPLFNPSLFTGFTPGVCRLGSTAPSTSSITAGAYSPDRINLICTAFHLALLVVLRTLTRTVHWRRREMLAWAVSTALHVGPSACLYLVTNWAMYVSPREAVNWLAPALIAVIGKSESTLPGLVGHAPSNAKNINPNTGKSTTSFASRHHANSITIAAQMLGSAVPYSATAREHILAAVRHMALQAAAKDPVNCALPALTLAERNASAFDAVYRLVLHSAESGGLGPVQLFSLARYMDSNSVPIAYNPAAMYHPMGNGPASSTSVCPTIPSGINHAKLLSLDRPPLKALLDATINAFVTATHTRLANISPRQYAEFVDFLARARDTFHLLRPDGPSQFRSLVECLRQTYRGKRKLVSLLSERFG
ncbi:unnamed protein product [Echinostoma caproni]|uniref:Zinc finger SWIM domain-containing protein 8 n=1 Tax=Echinostoma caproni TaxID=27848 RepID=A0A183AI83_9TREM|nr:unnamed protein product [Echinostoma caproni]